MGAGLWPVAKASELPPDPNVGAPVPDSTVLGPLQRPDLAHAAPCEEKQADERHFTRTPFFMPFERT